jgi:MarR family transcriptional regulator, organic hydroperoxide resistance regulator
VKYESEQTAVLLALQRATHRTLHALGESLGRPGLTPAEITVLGNLADGPPRSVAELAALVGSRSSTLTGVLDRLEGRGLARRTPHPTDRRSLLVVLTGQGVTAAAEVRAAVAELERRLLDGVPATALDGCRTVLAALAAPGRGQPR